VSFDTVLTIIGVVLISFGLYIFLAGKGHREGTPSSKVEGFGIKVDVANPSILLIILGVGLVLVPRFFPDTTPGDDGASMVEQLPQMPAADPLLQALNTSDTAEEPPSDQSPQEAQQGVGLPAEKESVQLRLAQSEKPVGNPVATAKPAFPEATQRVTAATDSKANTAVAADPIGLEAPSPPVATARKPATPRAELPRQVAAVASLQKPSPAVAAPEAPPAPGLWVIVDADVEEYAGMKGMTARDYSQALRERLATLAAERLGEEYVSLDGMQPTIEDKQYTQACAKSPADRVLLATLRVPINDFSPVESSFWPHLVLAAVNCKDGRVHRSQPERLTPKRTDQVFFEQDFLVSAQNFIARQAYFLESN